MGGDHNSHPATRGDSELPLPQLEAITDRPHLLHRSCIGPDGSRLMDTRPDETLRTTGLEDLVWYWATAEHGDPAALTRTVNACPTHGPASRIDRFHATEQLLPALTKVVVIEVAEEISDHHILRVVFDADGLADIPDGWPPPPQPRGSGETEPGVQADSSASPPKHLVREGVSSGPS